jgi:hypothetical protein
MTDKSIPQAAPVAAIDSERFEAWARLHFGQGYGFQKEEGTYISAVTRWAAKAFNAGFDLAATPQAAPKAALPIIERDLLIDVIASALSGTLHCTRSWSAWRVGTMSDADFSPVEDSDTPAEVADAVIAAIRVALLQAAPVAAEDKS